MANYNIGLDFGTSQTKVCLLNIDSNIRKFVKFNNGNYFLPSLIVKMENGKFTYGNENEIGTKYRYFKMAAAEDEELIQITNEDLNGDLQHGTINDFRKYSTNFQIKPDHLVVLYLTYINLFIQDQTNKVKATNLRGLFSRLVGNQTTKLNTYSINLGIPTEWNNPKHNRRKIKFQSLLITAAKLSLQFENIDLFLNASELDLIENINLINNNHSKEINGKIESEKEIIINKWLNAYQLSVFPESAAGVNYLLKTKRLANSPYATLDIGAGTSDIAIFEVNNNCLTTYYCSESIEIASNDFYREYAKLSLDKLSVTFDEIKETETAIMNNDSVNSGFYFDAKCIVKGFLNNMGIEFAIRKTFYRKYYHKIFQVDQARAFHAKRTLSDCKIIVFGGGANLDGFSTENYCFYQGSNPLGNQDSFFAASPITDYVTQVELDDDNQNIENQINLLILALGLTYFSQNENQLPFITQFEDFSDRTINQNERSKIFYYDLLDSTYY